MLHPEEIEEINAEIPLYPHKRAVCIEALKIVQRRRGWVSDEAVEDVARFLEMTPAEIDGVATYYNLIFRKPVGRHVILVCDSVTCWILNGDNIIDHLKRKLGVDFGETTADGRFTLLPTVCLGICEQAPAFMIDEDVYGNLTPDRIDRILEGYP